MDLENANKSIKKSIERLGSRYNPLTNNIGCLFPVADTPFSITWHSMDTIVQNVERMGVHVCFTVITCAGEPVY